MSPVLYVHGKGGSAAEAEHFRPLFPGCDVAGLDYQTDTPWETGEEIRAAVEGLTEEHRQIVLIANSIGAYFCMHAGIGERVRKAYFISPIVDMEKLIRDRMTSAGVSMKQLEEQRVIRTGSGEDLSWEYLCWVRAHPIRWPVPTGILYGGRDQLTSYDTIAAFAREHGALLTVMEHGGHWFHTEEQMRFLDEWIRRSGKE